MTKKIIAVKDVLIVKASSELWYSEPEQQENTSLGFPQCLDVLGVMTRATRII